MKDLEQDLQEEKTYPEMRKGFKGFWWNLINCGKLSPSDQKIVMKNVMVKGLLSLIPIVLLITAIILGSMAISKAVENSKPYSQVSVEEFRKNWNSNAETNPNGVTEGITIKKSEVEDGWNSIDLKNGSITIKRSGRDFKELIYESSKFIDIKDKEGLIKDILSFCMPDINHTATVKKYLESSSKYVQSEVKGFCINFEEAETESEIEYTIEANYNYSHNIVKANTLTGCAYDCTLDEFVKNFNNNLDDLFEENAQHFKIGDISQWHPIETQTFGDIKIDVYSYSLYSGNEEIGGYAFFVEQATGKILRVTYTLGCDVFNRMTVEIQEGYVILLPKALFGALGFSYNEVMDVYLSKVKPEDNNTYICDGTYVVNDTISLDGLQMYRMSMYAYGDGEKSVSTNNSVEENTKQENETTVPTTEKVTTTEDSETETQTTVIQNEDKISGKMFISRSDKNSGYDTSNSNYIKFENGKAIIQMNLLEMVFQFEADYTIDGNTITLGEGITADTNMLICSKGVQLYFVSEDSFQITGMENNFALSGWSCPYQFADLSEFVES
ncbi:MAG: hypothetical protein J6A49_10560 [Clostridia bacterium]|nr:hypothetical protein [Clostridia bacterium]